MRQRFSKILAVMVFILIFIRPREMFSGAAEGLMLWFHTVLPTLFPFIFITDMLFYTDGIRYISKISAPLLSCVFRTSKNGGFAVLTGFLCGCPAGAKVTADMVAANRISKDEGCYLLSFCNNLSPVFIINFILAKTLGREDLTLPTLMILFTVPVFMSFILRRFYLKGKRSFPDLDEHVIRKNTGSSAILDTCILDAFESITKVGGYIILFSALIRIIQSLPFPEAVQNYILPCLEVTNGIDMIGKMEIPFPVKYQAILTLTSFGGLCAAAQTGSMVKKADIPMDIYITEKMTAALAVSLAALIYLNLS